MNNNANYDVGGQVGGGATNVNDPLDGSGLKNNDVGLTIAAIDYYEADHPAQVNKRGTYYITDYQCYFDGGRSYTVSWSSPNPPTAKLFVAS